MSPGISRLYRAILFATSLMGMTPSYAAHLKHELFHLQGDKPGKTVLIVGGIQGDEPGGFTAASLLVTNYKIHKGNLWVIPNLNFNSIVESSRGLYGDMNRKFRSIKVNDPDYDAVEDVKRLIRNKKVDLVLNLHDGSGYYRQKYHDKLHNPYRWGQSIVIDQSYLQGSDLPELEKLGTQVANTVNNRFGKDDYRFHVKNTRTRDGNNEMQKTLTYYAVKHNKAAFGLEASKGFVTHERVYFHLSLIEEFLKLAGVEFDRDFSLDMRSLHHLIGRNLALSLYQKRISLHLDDIQKDMRYFPIRRDEKLEFTTNNPLVAVVKSKGFYKVKYGNRNIINLYPQYFDYDTSLDKVMFEVDGQSRHVDIGSTIQVESNFKVKPVDGYRVNVIGFVSHKKSEDDLDIARKNMLRNYSVDKDHDIYRVEFYKQDKFSGMILVKFQS